MAYVDDLILTSNSSLFDQQVIHKIGQNFSMKDLCSLHYFLGVEVIPNANGLFLTQKKKYIRDLLTKHHLDGAKAVQRPLSTFETFQLHDGTPAVDNTIYRHIIGALQYLSLIRPNVAYLVNKS